jgi:hypothetical protein
MEYCISCGKQGTHWPKGRPVACTMRCAATRTLGQYSASSDGFYCPDCGEPAESLHCGASDEVAETVSVSWMARLLRRQS